MSARLRSLVVPAFLFAALLIGGSSQAGMAQLPLQLLGLALLGWAMLAPRSEPMPGPSRTLLRLAGVAVLLPALQLVPLPPGLWSGLPGRSFLAQGFALLGRPLPWQPLSLAPFETLAAILALIAPAAVLAAMLRVRAFSRTALVLALLAATLLGGLLGIVQVMSSGAQYYLYRFSAFGTAAGFFANSNHMATLLLAALPFLAALAADRWQRTRERQARAVIVAGGLAFSLVLVIAIALNGSLAILMLGLPVALASLAMLGWDRRPRLRRPGLVVGAVALLGSIGAIPLFLGDHLGSQTSFDTRTEMWATSARALSDHGLLGSGIGSFPTLYPTYEDPAAATNTFVNHAHNDLLELTIEAGVPGLVLLALFLFWWARQSLRVWRRAESDHFARAATIVSATMLLHSLVDYPLRTPGLLSLFAACLALIALPATRRPVSEKNELRPSRHATID